MGNGLGTLGATLGSDVANLASTPGGVFLPGATATPDNISAINNFATGPSRDLVDSYVGSRGVLSLDDANTEMLNYSQYLKTNDPSGAQSLLDLVQNQAPKFAADHGIDVSTATGILMATQPFADPNHPTGNELMEHAVGLDLYDSTILYGQSLSSH